MGNNSENQIDLEEYFKSFEFKSSALKWLFWPKSPGTRNSHPGLNSDMVLRAPRIDRFGAFEPKPEDASARIFRESAFQNFIRPNIDYRLGRAREEVRNPDFKIGISENTKTMIFDDLIRTLDENGADSGWLRELRAFDFPIYFKDFGEKGVVIRIENGERKTIQIGGFTIPHGDGFAILMNAGKFSNFSPEMEAELLHELRHVWQHYQDFWKARFGDGVNTKTDVDVEVDAFKTQFLLEKILNTEDASGRIFFDFTDRDSSLSSAQKQRQKALYLFRRYGYSEKGYRLKSPDEYEQEFADENR